MLRPTKKQINIKMPQALIKELKARAELQNDTFTDLVIRLCEQGLGSDSNPSQTTAPPFEPDQLDERIAKSIAAQIAPLQERIEDRIASTIQKELEPMLGELSA